MSSLEIFYNYFFVGLSVLVFVSCLLIKFMKGGQDDYSCLAMLSAVFGVFGFFVWLVCLPLMVGYHLGWEHVAWGIVASVVCFFMYKRIMRW